ncbi:MAG: alanine--glyoxylate aminotransferase family protein [Deltaproteobacteria bacterium]|nr:alanine--glyoxylate aminotransferase family protein [Deltaproteobacteria bacterium]
MQRDDIRFFLPGPAYVPEDVRQAMTRPIVSHRSAEFRAVYQRLAEALPQLFRTQGEVFIATGSSTFLMESALVSTVDQDVLHLTNGAFSERWHQISGCLGKRADRVAVPWGEAMDPDLVREALRRKSYEAVTLVHNETSTGVVSDVAAIARVVHEESDALLLVDTVSGLGGAEFETDEWQVDVALAGVQKAIALPPGLGLFTLSPRAALRAEGQRYRGFYTDLLRYRDKHQLGGTITTPAIPLVYALDFQMKKILQEGVVQRWRRHEEMQLQTEGWAEGSGFQFAAAPEVRSPTVSCLKPPLGVPSAVLIEQLAKAGFTVASGYGPWKRETFRVGHMGEVRVGDLSALFSAIDSSLEALDADSRKGGVPVQDLVGS